MARPPGLSEPSCPNRPSPGPPAILAESVRRTFGDVVALDGVDLEV
jgi:hypothetical protein